MERVKPFTTFPRPPLFLAVLLVVAAAVAPAVTTRAAEQAARDARIAGILGSLPAPDPGTREALCRELLELGPAAIEDLCARVLPGEAGDDTRARYALNALATHVTRPGASDEEQQHFERSLTAGLRRASAPEVQTFLITQLGLAGSDACVGDLAPFLQDGNLAEPAIRALVSIRGVAAERALLAALGTAPIGARPALLTALGELRVRSASGAVSSFVDSPDSSVREAARRALATMGDPVAGPLLERSWATGDGWARMTSGSLVLLHARRMFEDGNSGPALETARRVLAETLLPAESHLAAQALDLLVSILGERALPELLGAVERGDARLRGAALQLAAAIPGADATAAWVQCAEASPSDARAAILTMLGDRGDVTALAFARANLPHPDVAVQLAAIDATARLGATAVLADLLPMLDSAEGARLAALKDALLGLPADLVIPAALERLNHVPAPAQAALIETIGRKGAHEQADLVFAHVGAPDSAVRSAALEALAHLAGEDDLPRLLDLLAGSPDASTTVRVQEALVAAARRNPAVENRADRLLALLPSAGPTGQLAILRVLPAIGGTKALAAVVEATRQADPRQAAAAVQALSQWPDEEAADDLLKIARTADSRRNRVIALEGYVRVVGRSDLEPARKLGLLATAFEVPAEDGDRATVLGAVSGIRTLDAFLFLAKALESSVLRPEATARLLEMASYQAPDETWLSDHRVISVLRGIEASEPDPAQRIRTSQFIDARLKQGGYVPLFNGRDLSGWKGLVGNPVTRARMPAVELEQAQAAADERMRAHWSVGEGVLVFDGAGESLCTAADYEDFELLLDWKIEAGGDSGIYLRGSPQVQIWDGAANAAGSGGLYNNEKGPSQPLAAADRPVGEWNTFRIFMLGERVTVYLNDRLVVDNTVLENYWERDKPIYPRGAIELQAHGNPLWFRNLYVRPISRDGADAPLLTSTERAKGFVPLFNGRNLEGWVGAVAGHAVENGKLVVRPGPGSGNLYTESEYADFVLRLEFKLTPGANNGLGIRAPLAGDAAYLGMELQILDDSSPKYWGLHPWQYHGSVYGVVPAARGALRPVGEWNSQEVVVLGRQVRVILNGTTIVDADLDAAGAGNTPDGRVHPGLGRDRGHIGFLSHGSIVEFRNIRIRELGR